MKESEYSVWGRRVFDESDRPAYVWRCGVLLGETWHRIAQPWTGKLVALSHTPTMEAAWQETSENLDLIILYASTTIRDNSICFNHDSCSLKKENIVHAHKSCPNNCSEHGEFVLVDIIIITEFVTASCLILTVIAIAYADMALRVAMCFYCGWATSQTAVPQRFLRKFAKPISEFQKFCGDQAIFISIIAFYKIRFSWQTCLHLQRFNTCFIL